MHHWVNVRRASNRWSQARCRAVTSSVTARRRGGNLDVPLLGFGTDI